MDADDRHYYCCGDCKALFPTLRGLGKHKEVCDGSKLVGNAQSLYVYEGSYLQKLLECCTTCSHTDTCPVITRLATAPKTPPASHRSRNSGRLVIPKGRATPAKEPQKRRQSQARNCNDGSAAPRPSKRQRTKPQPRVVGESGNDGEGRMLEDKALKCLLPPVSGEGAVEEGGLCEGVDAELPSDTLRGCVPGEDHVKHTLEVKPEEYVNDHETTASGTTVTDSGSSQQNGTIVILTSELESPHLEEEPETGTQSQISDAEVLVSRQLENIHVEISQMEATPTEKEKFQEQLPATSELTNPTEEHKPPANKPVIDNIRQEMKKFRKQLPLEGSGGHAFFYVCDVCDWKTPHLGFFARHQKCHNGSAPGSRWDCDLCDFSCKSSSEMKRHCDKHSKPFMCEFCSWRFARKKDLTRHLYIHSGDLPYKCDQCDYRCRQPKSLSDHMRKHTGELVSCPFEGCDFKSVYKWAVKSHHLSKHVPTKRFQCPQCAYKTSDSNSMVRHRRLHAGEKNFKCSLCNYRAVAKHEIVRHMRSHTKEKVYFCDRCEYSTSHASGLRIHMMNHLGVKPWQCVLCGYNSLTRSKVLRHVRQTHKGQGPADACDAVVNLGLKLDIDIKEYKTPHGECDSSRVVYDDADAASPQEDPAAGTVELIVQGLPLDGEGCIQVVAAEDGSLVNTVEGLDLSALEGLQLKQLGNDIQVTYTSNENGDLEPHTEHGPGLAGDSNTWHIVHVDDQQPPLVAAQEEEVVTACQTVEIGDQETTCLVAVDPGGEWTETEQSVVPLESAQCLEISTP